MCGRGACVHGALANLPCSSSNVGWEVVVSLLGLGGAVEEEVIVMTIMASSMPIIITAPSQAAAAGMIMSLMRRITTSACRTRQTLSAIGSTTAMTRRVCCVVCLENNYNVKM
jgi:hypothetical protein